MTIPHNINKDWHGMAEIDIMGDFCVYFFELSSYIIITVLWARCDVISEAAYSENYFEYIVEYNGDSDALMKFYDPDQIRLIDNRYAVVYQRLPADHMESFSRLEYTLFPKVYGSMDDDGALEAIGAVNVKQQSILGLTGRGMLLGIVDCGLDIYNDSFLREGRRSRILAAWDQTVEGSDTAIYGYGMEYSAEEIQAAIDSGQKIITDVTGHGTFCGGTAMSVATEADLAVVKLKQAKQNLRSLYGIPSEPVACSEVDIMTGIAYLLKMQQQLRRPMCILVTWGSNSGSHTGAGALEKYINNIGDLKGLAVAVAGGNEGRAGHHYRGLAGAQADSIQPGIIADQPENSGAAVYDTMEIEVANNDSFTLEIWGNAVNTYSVALEVPGGEYIERISPRYDKSTMIRPIFGGGTVYVDYFLIEDAAGQELIMMRFITPANGIWRVRVYGIGDTELSFNAWLPISSFISPQTKFVRSDPRTTLTSPSSAETAICACAYDYTNGNLYIDNSRGYTADRRVKPDFLAPGVNIQGDGPGNEAVIRSGTSIAAAYAAGGSILLLEWSYDRNDVRTINGNQIRHYLIRGAVRPGAAGSLVDIRNYPNPEWGYGLLNIYNTFESLRNV